MTREEIRTSLSDSAAMSATLLGECANEPLDGQVAVACVIRNRVLARSWFGRTYAEVCLKKAQFSCWWEANGNTDRVYTLADALVRRQPAPELAPIVNELNWIVTGVQMGAIRDRTGGANHYLTTALYDSKDAPTWARDVTPVAVIGRHSFFKL